MEVWGGIEGRPTAVRDGSICEHDLRWASGKNCNVETTIVQDEDRSSFREWSDACSHCIPHVEEDRALATLNKTCMNDTIPSNSRYSPVLNTNKG